MTKLNERMNTLVNNGIDTSKYYNLAIDKSLPKGTTLTVTIGEDGLPTINKADLQEMLNKIDDQGYVKNSKLFRRWVMAQTFRMMKHEGGYTGALNAMPYRYQWTMLVNELHAMSKIEKEDPEQFAVRKDFFTKEVIIAMLEDYKEKMNAWAKNYRWVARKANVGVMIADITINAIKDVRTYEKYYMIMNEFLKEISKKGYENLELPKDTTKCKEWMEAYKGAGAYYSLQNYIRFHAGKTVNMPWGSKSNIPTTRKAAEILLEKKREEYKGEWWKLFGYFKKVIEFNNFDFDYAMYKKYHA